MNRKSITAIASVALLSIVGLTAAVYAAGDRGGKFRGAGMHPGPEMGFMHPGMMGGQLLHRLGNELELTDTQRESIKGLLESARPNMKALRDEMRVSAGQLRDTDPGAPNYAAVVAQASRKAGEVASRLVTDGSQLRAGIWQVLTPEQRSELESIRGRFQDRMQERRGRHERRGPPPEAPAVQSSEQDVMDGTTLALDVIPTMVVRGKRIRA